jgi:hypothetical protein
MVSPPTIYNFKNFPDEWYGAVAFDKAMRELINSLDPDKEI